MMNEWSSALKGTETLLGKQQQPKERKRTKGLYVLTTMAGVRILQQRKGTLVNWGQGTTQSHTMQQASCKRFMVVLLVVGGIQRPL